jgi:hypothetical protein
VNGKARREENTRKNKRGEWILSKWNLEKYDVGGTDLIDLAQDRDQWKGSCEHGHEPWGCMERWEVLE